MNDIEIIFERAGLDIPHEYLAEIYHSELRELLLEELAYFACRDSLPKLMSKNLGKDNFDLKGRIINKTNFYGYILYKNKTSAEAILQRSYKTTRTTYIYHNPISNTDRFLSKYEINLYKQIKQALNKNQNERIIIIDIIKSELNKLESLHKKELHLKNKAHNASIENILDELTTAEKQLYIYIKDKNSHIIEVIKELKNPQYTIKNIKELKPSVMQADIPDEYYFLDLQKPFENQQNNIKNHLNDLQHKENLSFKNLTGLQIYQTLEDYYKKQNLTNVSYLVLSLLYSIGIKGLYDSENKMFSIFNPNDIKNIKIVS